MRELPRNISGLVTFVCLVELTTVLGCSGNDPSKNDNSTSGGSDSTDSGGASSRGGNASNRGGSPTGGKSSTGGKPSVGGSDASGGAEATGGSTATTGGAEATGGSTATTGGAEATGGSTATTGGTTTSTGGTTTSTGGTEGTGGSTSTNTTNVCTTPIPSLSNESFTVLTTTGMSTISYGGYLNGESFQQDGILSYNGYQYASFWNTDGNVVLARRVLSTDPTLVDGDWQKIEPIAANGYVNESKDAHNTISLGVSPADGTLHLAIDHHVSTLHYLKSVPGLLTNPATANWSDQSFTAITSELVTGATVDQVTYPRFITEPGGNKMLFSARIGTSGSGDEYLWEYDGIAQTWTSLGKYLWGTYDANLSDNVDSTANAYPHGISYTKGGNRLHVAWCWRETPDPITNHDLFYAYSDDHGRTWLNNAGDVISETGKTFITKDTTSAKVWTIEQNRGLINQEHMAVDALGRVHVLLSHVPDGVTTTVGNFTTQRTQSTYFHYMRDTNGTWTRHSIADTPVWLNFRGKFAIPPSNNVYAILPIRSPVIDPPNTNPALRIVSGSPCDNYATWTPLTTNHVTAYFSDPLIDTSRLETGYELTVYYPLKNYNTYIRALEYTLK